MEDVSLKEKLARQENELVALLSQHHLATDAIKSKAKRSSRKNKQNSDEMKAPDQQLSKAPTPTSPLTKTLYQDELSERMNYEEMLRQSNMDHEQALKEKEKQVSVLQARLLQQREDIEVILLREKSVKYYGGLLTSSVDAALLNNNNSASELTEENIRFMSKVTSTLNYLLNDGDITHSIEKEVTEAERGATSNPASVDVEEEKMQEALKKSIKNRRGSINAVPFESAMLYGQPTEQTNNNDVKSSDRDQHTGREEEKRSVSKSRRGTLNAIPLNVGKPPTSSSSSSSPPRIFNSIDEICIEEENEDDDDEDDDDDDDGKEGEDNTAITSMSVSAVSCHCRQLIPFHVLPRDFEKQCGVLFQAVYHRSCMGFNAQTKTIEVQAPRESKPVNQWIGKSAFLSFLFNTGNIDAKLTMQAVIYCFDKAAHENSTRSRYKLNMRIYYEDFLSALTSAAQFKYSGGGSGGGGDSTGDSDRRSKLKKIVNVCSQSMAMKNEMVYYELSNIFKYCKSPDFFTTMSNSQLVLLKAYKRCVNYACTNTGFQGHQKRQWASNTAANGNKAMSAQTSIESSGQGFYYFCKSFNIFPALTQEGTCRRVAQHVRKICDDSTTSFFACLIYLAVSLATNTDNNSNNNSSSSSPSPSEDETTTAADSIANTTATAAIDPLLSARMTSIIERIVVHIEGETLKLDRL